MLIVLLILAIIGIGYYLYKNEKARNKVINFFSSILETIKGIGNKNQKEKTTQNNSSNLFKIIAIVIMIVGIVFICVGINANHYAKSHVWGDPGSISDREHKAPYIEKYKNCCMAGGIITFVGFLVFISKGRNTVIIAGNKKENNDNIKKLEELKKLADNGTITQEDFEKKKKELLDKM